MLEVGTSTYMPADGTKYYTTGAHSWYWRWDPTTYASQWYNTRLDAAGNYMEFAFNYSSGQWQEQGKTAAGLFNVGLGGRAGAFLGDGTSASPVDLGNWSFAYTYASDLGSFYKKVAQTLSNSGTTSIQAGGSIRAKRRQDSEN